MLELFKLHGATTLATRPYWSLLGPILGLLALSFALWGSWALGVDHGMQTGVDAYHNMCYNSGGLIVDEGTGTVVLCKGLTEIPQQELKKNFQGT